MSNHGTGLDWGGFIVRLAAWLLVFACVFAIFYGMTGKPRVRLMKPVPEGASFPHSPVPGESMPSPEPERRPRYSV